MELVPALKELPLERTQATHSSHAIWLEQVTGPCGETQFRQALRRSRRRHAATSSNVICVSGLTFHGNQQARKGP